MCNEKEREGEEEGLCGECGWCPFSGGVWLLRKLRKRI